MSSLLSQYGIGFVLILLQAVAAIPWLALLATDKTGQSWFQDTAGRIVPGRFLIAIGIVVALGVFPPALFNLVQDRDNLESFGRIYGSILHLQLIADGIIGFFALMLLVWPKGAAVALAAFREGLRQPMFYLLGGVALGLMILAPFIPYFTFGEDFIMMQELGYDTVMLLPLLLGVIAASMSISEEIEGRTAITLMSKPVSRRQFLLGKFFGILLATMVLTVLLGWFFNWVLLYKRWLDRMDPLPPLPDLTGWLGSFVGSGEASNFVRGIRLWFFEEWAIAPGLILGFGKVMILVAVAVSLATRLPMIVNLIVCLALYFMGHLTGVLQDIAARRNPNETVGRLLSFFSKVFDIFMPRLDLFSLGPALVQDRPLTEPLFLKYVAMVFFFSVIFTTVTLLLGLVLFEDRDLA
ncbi:MAG TPA: ABC transporter permease [Gemmataceae bacterium]|nr:ABC transporter permease [Gemmataceae bacterium]